MKTASMTALVAIALIAVVLLGSSAAAYELTQADRDFLAKKIVARCAVTQRGQVEGLYRLGIDILEDYPDLRNGYVTVLVNADQFEELQGVGFQLDVITDDWYRSYAAKTPQTMGGFQTYDEIAGELYFLSFVHSDIASLFSIGQSIEGREQWVIKISDNPDIDEDEPEVFFDGLTHAREPIGPALLMETVRRLLNGYGSDTLLTRLVNEREIFILPIVNPDGYVYNELIAPNGGGMWRKNRNPEFAPFYGIDLNRNYGYMWGYNDFGSSGDPSSEVYRGTAPFSEPEIANIRAFTNSREFVFAVNYHSHSDLILWSWAYDFGLYTPDEQLFQVIGDSMATFNGYYPTVGWGLYPVNGGVDDWMYGATDEHAKIYSFLFEVGYWFWPDPSDIAGEIEENQEPNLLIMKLANDPEQLLPEAVPALAWELSTAYECEYHAPPGGIRNEALTISNAAWGSGTGTLTGDVTVTEGADWLSLSPGGSFNLDKGDPAVVADVVMDAGGLTEGLYTGTIQITHNDPAQTSPLDIPVEFFVFDDFHCPQTQVLKTGVASPGIVSLAVSNNARFAAQNEGGMWRALDSSSSVFDASLVVAHGNQDPDTVVFHRCFYGDDPGQYGWRALGDLVIDTSAYGTGIGDPAAYATATASMTTADSVIGVDVEWYFPQAPAYADFVIARYTVSNRTAAPVNDVVLGLWIDLDVLAATHLRNVQDDAGNHGHFVPAQNLVYQYGYDMLDHTPVDDLNSSQRYSGGVSYLAGRDASGAPFSLTPATLRAGVDDNRLNQVGGGPSSGLMYQTLVGPLGITVWEPYPSPDSSKDAFTWLTLDQGRTLDANGANPETYIVALVCDTLAHDAYPSSAMSTPADLGEIVDSAWAWTQRVVMCNCPCHADPQCDGATDVLDVVHAVNVAFRSVPPVFEGNCPIENTDADCSGFTNVIDVVKFVNVAFRGGLPEDNFCVPCP